MLSNSQREHLTYTAIGQVFTICISGLICLQYIFPGISTIDTNLVAANAEIKNYEDTRINGISYSNIGGLISGKPERLELIKIMQSDPTLTEQVIKKTGDQDYLTWITQSIGKSDSDKQVLIQEKMKLNSIIPTMSPISANIEEDNVTLKQFVKFIEGNILKQFNFDTNVVIGMQGISFGDKGTNGENIGMFEFRFDFKGTNSDISRFITYINTSGKPDLLANGSGTTTVLVSKDKIPGVLGNPLISMTSFSLQNILNPDNPNAENSGRVTLKFHVRGISKDDITYLRESVKKRKDAVGKKIEDSLAGCEKDGAFCEGYKKKLNVFKVKYAEFIRSFNGAKVVGSGTDEIYVLSQAMGTIKSLEKELDGILPKSSTK